MGKKEAARKTGEAVVASVLPDVCWTKLGPLLVPVPYAITSRLELSVDVVSNVKQKGVAAFSMRSRTTHVTGDELGVAGIFSGVVRGYCRPTTHSSNVRAGAEFLVRHKSQFWMNCNGADGTPNTIGKLIYVKIESFEEKFQITETDRWEAIKKARHELWPWRGWWNDVNPLFEMKVRSIANEFNLDPNELMAVMAFETGGSFSPSQKNNAGSGAVGLIQFMPNTALGLGTTSDDLARMNSLEQLDYVRKHISMYQSKVRGTADLYMTVLYPAATGKDDDYVLFDKSKKPLAYEQNKGLDSNSDGLITKKEAAAKVVKLLEEQRSKELSRPKDMGGVRITA